MKRIFVTVLAVMSIAVSARAEDLKRSPQVYVGDAHSVAVDSKGDLWCWGDNYYGQIGNGKITKYNDDNQITQNNDANKPVKIMSNVICAAAGDGFTLALTDKNVLYGWGNNSHGQLAVKKGGNILVPTKIMDNVTYVDACNMTAAAIKKDGSLWMWGYDIRTVKSWDDGVITPTKIQNSVDQVSVGSSNLLTLSGNDVFTIGDKISAGVDYNGSPNTRFTEPEKVMSGVRQISSGKQQSYAVTKDNELYAWGYNGNDGAVGVNSDEFIINRPTYVTNNVKAVIGKGGMFIKTDGSLWIWGYIPSVMSYKNAEGIDGGGSLMGDIKVYGKKPVKILENIVAASGDFHHLAADKNGQIFSWGNNLYGQLGHGLNTTYKQEKVDFGDGYYDYLYTIDKDHNAKEPKPVKFE